MSKEAPNAAPQNEEVAQQAWELPKTEAEFHLAVVTAVSQILSIPSNIQAMAASMFSAGAGALSSINTVNQRMETKPQVTRVEYPGSLRGTVVCPVVGQYDVVLEQRNEAGEWVPATKPDYVLVGAKKLMLSQSTFEGDVWFLTTIADVHQYQDSMMAVATSNAPPAAN